MNIVAIYRLYPPDNRKNRPAYYSKLTALASFLRAWRELDGPKRLIVNVDAEELPAEYAAVLDDAPDEVHLTGGLGNSASYKALLDRLDEVPDGALVYFGEDDYLYLDEAFVQLRAAALEIPDADFFTLYDHRDRYTRTDDAKRWRERVFVAGDRHWRTVESTCMTFGARVEVLRRDRWVHRVFSPGAAPRDRLIWRFSQGVGPFFWKLPKRVLVGPMPTLATHADTTGLAPLVDWAAVATAAEADLQEPLRSL